MSTTPETEAHMGDSSPDYALYYEGIATSKVVPAKLASKLERERDAAKAEIKAMRKAIKEAYDAVILGENPLPKLHSFLKP